MAASDFTEYLSWGLEDLLARLAQCCNQIGEVAQEIARARSTEIDAKSSAWNASVETSVTARGRAASFAAAPATQTVLELEGMKEWLKEQRDFLRLLIDVRVRTKELVGG